MRRPSSVRHELLAPAGEENHRGGGRHLLHGSSDFAPPTRSIRETTARPTNFPWQAVNEVIAEAETLEEGYMNSNTIFAILEYIPVYEFVTYLKLVDC
jgi:hypothetical protein